MSWFDKLMPSRIRTESSHKRAAPEGIWAKCPGCNAILYRAELERNLEVCPKCTHHNRIRARRRLETFLDPEPREEIAADLESMDPLKFKDLKKYKDRLVQAEKQSGEKEALVVLRGRLKGAPLVAAAFEFEFMGGSMGSVVGERRSRRRLRLGAGPSPGQLLRERRGPHAGELFSLMQMAKTSAALARLREQAAPFVSFMTDPTTGGVASFAMLGDIQIAEPSALIGFAGPGSSSRRSGKSFRRVSSGAEFLLEKGALDMILDRRDLRERIAELLAILMRRPRH